MKVSTPSDLKIPPHLDQQLRQAFPSLEGWCSWEKAVHLIELVLNNKPRLVVEIGVHAGKSLIPLGLAMRWLNANEAGFRGTVAGVDPWSVDASIAGGSGTPEHEAWWSKVDHDKYYNQTVNAVKTNGLTNEINIYRMTSEIASTKLPSPDLLHIDGNHSEQCSCQDVDLWLPKLKMGGIVVFDDTDWVSTKAAQQKLEKWCGSIELSGPYGWGRKIVELKN